MLARCATRRHEDGGAPSKRTPCFLRYLQEKQRRRKEKDAVKAGKKPFYLKKCASPRLSCRSLRRGQKLLRLPHPPKPTRMTFISACHGVPAAAKKKEDLIAKYAELKAKGKLESFMTKRRKKLASKDRTTMLDTRRTRGEGGTESL